MTQTPDPGAPAPTAPPPTRLRRSRSDRMVAGVCGGLAETLSVDPVVIRVFLVVLTCFGGVGAVAYVAGWLLMPDGDDEAIAQGVLHRRGRGRGRAILAVALGAVAVIVAIRTVSGHHARGPLLVLILIGAFLLIRSKGRCVNRTPMYRSGAAQYPVGPRTTPTGPDQPTAPVTPPGPVPPPGPIAPRSALGRIVTCLVLIGLGVLAAADALGADVPLPAYPALVLTGAGLGLLVATRYGRARGLIALGLLGALALPPAAFAQEFAGPIAHHRSVIAPTSTGGLPALIQYRAGDVAIDLSGLDLTGGNAATTVHLGAGRLLVTVPARAQVNVHTELTAGRQEILGTDTEGFDHRLTLHDNGPAGPGGGTLDLTVRQGAGLLQIVRAPDAATGGETPHAQA